ncbi:MAG: protein kinase family protein [Dermatophilaceae bacterium]
MQGVGPGTILEGRYALYRRLSQRSDVERWSAHDTTLEREVAVTIVDSDHPNRAGILDAARRAAGVEDTRLVRILDVSTQAGSSYIVEETISGAESLADILLQGALPAEEARRIAGETASGLETARQRGLHHLCLTPHNVLRASDGAVKVSGVAVAAAITGAEEPDPVAASRRDAVAVVAVAYAALTSRWPLNEQVLGIEPAPRVIGGVPAPSEIAAGVPGDLDALCRLTLNEDTGPLTPGDFASQIAPWSREAVHRTAVDPTVGLDLPRPVPASTDRPTVGHSVAAAGAAATKAVDAALAGTGAAAGIARGKVGSFARAATDKAAAARAARTDTDLAGKRMTLPEALSAHLDEIEPPLPMLPASTAQAPSRDQSKIVVIIVAAFVTLSLLIGYRGVSGMGDGSSPLGSTPMRTVTVSAPPVTVAPSAPPTATQEGPPGGQPIAILSATGFDPQGDGIENNTQAPRVYDGNPATAWSSEGYNSAAFGGLKKGVGVLLDLGQPTSVNQVAIDLAKGPVDFTVYAATTPGLDGATVIGSATAASGHVELKAASTMPRAQYVIVWFTKLAPDAPWFRAAISEIALS